MSKPHPLSISDHAPMLNPHSPPPKDLRAVFSYYKSLSSSATEQDRELIDLTKMNSDGLLVSGARCIRHITAEQMVAARAALGLPEMKGDSQIEIKPIISFDRLPGLTVVPSLLSPDVQKSLLSRLLHRDLGDHRHKTNLHLHHHLPEREATTVSSGSVHADSSWFHHPPILDPFAQPKNPEAHKPLSISQIMNKKLRWVTLGGQYDWTAKKYPDEDPPEFPVDVAHLIRAFFPDMRPEAAIVNLYSPGDTLSLHRDVSEQCERPLVSISLGCDGIFVVGLANEAASNEESVLEASAQQRKSQWIALRLRSGDAVYMDGSSRFAWHAVPKILPETCPSWLRRWPASSDPDEEAFAPWDGWMSTKRLNLNVRQMYESDDMGG